MTWSDDEKSVHDAEPVELYKFEGSVTDYFLTSHDEDFLFSGDNYVRTTIKRDSVKSDADPDKRVLVVTLPRTEQVVQDYAFNIAPPDLELTIIRVHPFTMNFQTIWNGKVTGFTVSGQEAKLRSPTFLSEAIESTIPGIAYQQLCNHVLYDTRCGVARGSFTTSTTVSAISSDGFLVTVAAVGGLDPFHVGGEIIRTSTGERRLILAQSGVSDKVLQLQFPFSALSVSDAVDVAAGCDHTQETCDSKFDIRENFGGHAFVPIDNIWTTHLGLQGKK